VSNSRQVGRGMRSDPDLREAIGVLFVSVELPRQLQEDAVNLLVTLK